MYANLKGSVVEEPLRRFSERGVLSKMPGRVHSTTHVIDTGDNLPCRSRPRPMSKEKRDILDYHLDSLLEGGGIEPCKSSW
jgi:hypothetical protein